MHLPPWLTEILVFGNPVLRWSAALVAGVVTLLGLQILRTLLGSRLRRQDRTESARWNDLFALLLAETKGWFFLAVALYVASLVVALHDDTSILLRQTLVLVLLVQAAFWSNTAIAFLADRYRSNEHLDSGRRTSLAAVAFVGRLALYSLLLLVALDNLGVDITALVAGLGITSIAVALALQGILSDLFASLSIVFDKPFEIGDFIIVDDMVGTVENVGLRTTRVRSLSGEQLIFANKDLLDSRIRNFKRMEERRVVFEVGVTYGTPKELLERIPSVIREAVEAQGDTRFDRSHFKSFGAYSLDFETVYYVLSSDYIRYMDIQQGINLMIYDRFAELGVEFAFPTQSIILEGGAPGDTAPS